MASTSSSTSSQAVSLPFSSSIEALAATNTSAAALATSDITQTTSSAPQLSGPYGLGSFAGTFPSFTHPVMTLPWSHVMAPSSSSVSQGFSVPTPAYSPVISSPMATQFSVPASPSFTGVNPYVSALSFPSAPLLAWLHPILHTWYLSSWIIRITCYGSLSLCLCSLAMILLGYVDGSFPCPVQYLCDAEGRTIPNPGYSAWVKTDQSVRSWLNATLTKDILIEVHDLQTSREVWLALEQRFVDQSTASELQLKFALLNHRKGNKTVVVYLRELKEIVDSLTAINSPISNKDLVLQALHGLPLEYEAFVTAITNMKEPPSFAQLRAKLLHQEQRLKDIQNASNSDQAVAFVASSAGSDNRKRNGRHD